MIKTGVTMELVIYLAHLAWNDPKAFSNNLDTISLEIFHNHGGERRIGRQIIKILERDEVLGL